MRLYAIGDIHGHLELLRAAHARIAADKAAMNDPGAPVVHVGDLVDRGPDSRGVIDHLIAREAAGEPDVVLLGNHDQMMRSFLKPPRWMAREEGALRWLLPGIGGRQTLRSYGLDVAPSRRGRTLRREALEAVPASHRAYLEARPLSFASGGCFFCHAGIRPGVPLEAQDAEDLIWIRHEFLDDTRDHGALIVHGHTPVEAATCYGNHLNLDSGAAYGGPLSAVVIEGKDIWLLGETGRVPIRRAPNG